MKVFFSLTTFLLLLVSPVFADIGGSDLDNTSDEALAASTELVAGENLPQGKGFMTLIAEISVFLFVLAAGGYLLAQITRRGGLAFRPKSGKSGNLNISETKILGNKQFLMVVEYNDQKMLLGVGPGMINHLCYLNSSAHKYSPEQPIPDETLRSFEESLKE